MSPLRVPFAMARHVPTSTAPGSAPVESTRGISPTPMPLGQTANDSADVESTVTAAAPQATALRASVSSAAHSPPAPVHAHPRAAVASSKDATEATERAIDSEEESYARAHQAHFVVRDWTGALRAWDDYLQAYPSGRLVLEARYNRALTLVRLGRLKEARDALATFADAPLGFYRQREARTLVQAIEAHLSSRTWEQSDSLDGR